MKRLLFSIALVCVFFNFLNSQSLETSPVYGNPVLKSHAQRQMLERAAIVERMTGSNPILSQNRVADACPPEFTLGFNLVESGDSLVIELDTFELSHGSAPPTLTLLTPTLNFGTAQLDTTILVTYKANQNLSGIGIDTVLVEYSQPGFQDTIAVIFFVKRKGKVVVADPYTIAANENTVYCLDDELDLPAPKACSQFLSCSEGYDGNGYQYYYFTNYNYADTCLMYLASNFPGVDTICMRICDEWTVCDTFKIPFIVTGDTLSISVNTPFFDDFSSYEGPYPSKEYWLDNAVFRNNTLAKDPPSIGFVTFDGLDFRGDPYNISNGIADRLTSKPIDLSGFSASDQVSLRFYVAPKGYGFKPEVGDSLFLEFRNDQRKWIRVKSWAGLGSNVVLDSFPPFEFNGVKIDNAQFLHEAFQFRFAAKTSPADIGDLWHLDYVYLGPNVAETEQNFSDLAFSYVQADLLKNYTAMPYNQFKMHKATELNKTYKATVFNHFGNDVSFNDSRVTYIETTTNTDLEAAFTVAESGENFPSHEHTTRTIEIPPGEYDKLLSKLESINFNEFRNVQSQFAFSNNSQGSLFLSNDTVRLNTKFSDYFAHDDGTAERQFFIKHAVQGGENQVLATKYHVNEEDTLKAVQIMFPHINGDIEAQLFNLEIWIDSLESDPVYVKEFVKPFFANNVFDTLQGFTTYVLDDILGNETPIIIPDSTDFYIGFHQMSAAEDGIPIGFDLQHPCNCNYTNISDTFKLFSLTFQGSLMMRPVFGNRVNTSTDVDEQPESLGEEVSVYPNPTTGKLFFDTANGQFENYKVFVFNNLGQMVKQGQLEREMDMAGLVDGMYYVQIHNQKTGANLVKRIILQQSR